MKLGNVTNYKDVLENVFETSLPFETAEKICDMFPIIDAQHKKFITLKDKIISEYYTYQEETDKFIIKDKSKLGEVNEKLQKLYDIEFAIEKTTIPKLPTISPKALYYLKDLFQFI